MVGQSNNFDGTSVSGGFNVQGNQFNGPVNIGGQHRDEPDGLEYLGFLKSVNPEDERRRILLVKDKLITGSYSWILKDESFQSWLDGNENHLLWIKGGPGKGKTMMMAGLVDELPKARNSEDIDAVCYFFCQNSNTELRNVTSIVKGLIYMLVLQERSLVRHLQERYKAGGGERAFTGSGALVTLWQILEAMLRDFRGARVYLIVDGLDECDDPEFDNFMDLLSSCNITTPGKIKWLVTSRPLPRIEHIIGPDQNRHRISLEIKAQHVSQGVETFINEKVSLLSQQKHWPLRITQKVHSYLQKNAEGTFLWVALVCQRLRRFNQWTVEVELTKLASLQRGLDSFYERMMQVVGDEIPEYTDLCMNILRTTTLAYRPLRLQELETVIDGLQSEDPPSPDALRDLIERCGSFILVHEDTIYFVHQSAKDYLSAKSSSSNFPFDQVQEHTRIAERCLDTLNSCLKNHHFPDPASFSRQELGKDESRLLSKIAYACSYWIRHTLESASQTSFKGNFPNQGKIRDLFESRLIAWIHALGSLKEITACVRIMKGILDIQYSKSTDFFHMMQDTYRFLRLNRHIVEEAPNQAYGSALLFAPKSSWTRKSYQNHIPKWIRLKTQVNDTWDACLETLLGHAESVRSLTFSSDGSLLASRSKDCTRLWEVETGKCRGMSNNHSNWGYIAFSPDDQVLFSTSGTRLELLDTTTGSRQNLLVGHQSWIRRCLFAPNSQILASADDMSVRLWNISTGTNCGIFEFQGKQNPAMGFSRDSKRIAIAFGSDIQVRDVETSNIVATFREHRDTVSSIQFSSDSRLVLSVSYGDQIWLWDHAMTKRGKELEGPFEGESAKFSPDGSLIVSTYRIDKVILWETSTGNRLHVFTISGIISSGPIFAPDGRVMLTSSRHYGVKSWDTTTGKEIVTFEASEDKSQIYPDIHHICSKDGKLFAENMGSEPRIWEVETGALERFLEGHSAMVNDLEFSPVGGLIASASDDNTVKLWSLNKGPSNQATIRNGIANIRCVGVSLDGTLAASCSWGEAIHLWDLESGSSRTLHNEPSFYPKELLISPDNSLLAGRNSFKVLIWETESGSLRYACRKYSLEKIERMAYSPDGLLFKIEFQDGSIQLVENHAREFKDVRKPSHAEFTQSQNSPDGRFFIDLGPSLRACLWEKQKNTGQAILRFELGGAYGVATFSPDSRLVAFVSSERFISVWETETGVCLGVHTNISSCTGAVSFSHDSRFIACKLCGEKGLGLFTLSNGFSQKLALVCADPVNMVTFSPDASIVAATSGSAILMWETTSGSVARKLEYGEKRVSDIIFLPDCNILIAGHEDGTIRSWDTNTCVLLHTFSTKDRPTRFSLDSKRSFLWTGNQGIFLSDVLQPYKELPFSVEDDWVLFNRDRVFWLPPDFRPNTSPASWSACRKCLVVGSSSGNFTHVRFDI